MDYFNRYFTNKSIRQFVKFSFVGVSGTAIDWLVYFALTRWLGIYYLIAKTISFIIAATSNYFLNRKWTFRSQEKNIFFEYVKFIIVSAVGLVFNLCIMYFVVSILHYHDFVGLVLATAIVMIWNFFANKYWTFKEKK